jgi:hypothetical protein
MKKPAPAPPKPQPLEIDQQVESLKAKLNSLKEVDRAFVARGVKPAAALEFDKQRAAQALLAGCDADSLPLPDSEKLWRLRREIAVVEEALRLATTQAEAEHRRLVTELVESAKPDWRRIHRRRLAHLLHVVADNAELEQLQKGLKFGSARASLPLADFSVRFFGPEVNAGVAFWIYELIRAATTLGIVTPNEVLSARLKQSPRLVADALERD